MHTPRRLQNILRLIALAMLAHITLSWSLWYTSAGRSFPMLPVWGEAYLPAGTLWEGFKITLLLLSIAVAGVFPQKKYAAPVFAIALLFAVTQDMSRLQPWTYFYLLALGMLSFSGDDEAGALRSLQWLLAAVYAWGGLNKITPYFAADNFSWFCGAFAFTKPFGHLPEAGYAVAVAEMLLAPGLLWSVSRRVFQWVAIGFHLFIVVALSPLGLDWNAIVIPWNIAMAAMVWVLFAKEAAIQAPSSTITKRMWARRNARIQIILLSLAWLFPILNIGHCWDEPLSWKMYSNTQTEAGYFSENGPPCPEMHTIWEKYAYDSGAKLLFDDWAFDELNVPAYNSRRTHRQLAQYLCRCTSASGQAGLWQFTVHRWDQSREKFEIILCPELSQ